MITTPPPTTTLALSITTWCIIEGGYNGGSLLYLVLFGSIFYMSPWKNSKLKHKRGIARRNYSQTKLEKKTKCCCCCCHRRPPLHGLHKWTIIKVKSTLTSELQMHIIIVYVWMRGRTTITTTIKHIVVLLAASQPHQYWEIFWLFTTLSNWVCLLLNMCLSCGFFLSWGWMNELYSWHLGVYFVMIEEVV